MVINLYVDTSYNIRQSQLMGISFAGR